MHLSRMVELVGPFPADLVSLANKDGKYFDEHGNLLRSHSLPSQGTVMERLAHAGLQGEELLETSVFIYRALTLDPKARPSASELLSDPWLLSR
ncbi:hypothetical protein HGRIS_011113 [Hohenbuehelia grisea]|uniref:Uncharacterized protein n=1 Tax=Hohenbuehelia grisea TaxID=104357 RepID=A0ABR3IZB0_9AGAR